MSLADIFSQPIAHRGLHNRVNGVIENSATAFARAVKGGYGIECDLQLSGDGIPVVIHDSDLERLTGQTGSVSTLSAGQLGRISLLGSSSGDCTQTFEALLAQIGGAVPLIVELKQQPAERSGQFADAVVKAAADYAGPMVFKTFDPELIRLVRKAGHTRPLGIITMRYDDDESKGMLTFWQRFFLRHLLHQPSTKFDFISCDHTALRLPAVRLARRSGMKVMTWTVKSYDQEQAARRYADQIVFEDFLPQRA